MLALSHLAPRKAFLRYTNLQVVICLAIGYFVSMIVAAIYLGAFSQDAYIASKVGDSISRDFIRERNAAIGMPLVTVYAIICNYYLFTRARTCLFSFLNHNHVAKTQKWVIYTIARKTWLNLKISFVFGLGVTLTYLYAEGLLVTDALSESPSIIVFLNVSAVPFWSFSVLLVLQLIFITRFVIKHFLEKEKIGMFGSKKLQPISDLVISNVVITAFFIALFPLFWMGKEIPNIDKVITLFVFVALSLFLLRPVMKVHNFIATQKSQSIERINKAIFVAFAERQDKKRRLTDNPERLSQLSSLINLKHEINSVSSWPIDLPQGIKGIAVASTIPLSWAIGSIIESLISQFF
ncbi:hypothetical protein PN836_002790 [Ningiella sp. W23]|uniref:hypothetical protein n=1 Tax=Ningiella sp. W23 TaxID=3023715 RepID=UPI0037578172